MIAAAAMAISIAQGPPRELEPIGLPYQAFPAFMAYGDCVSGRYNDAHTDASTESETRQAFTAAIEVCRDERAMQLERALEAVSDARTPLDTRTYRNRGQARDAVRRAFDRFDTEFEVEAIPEKTGTDAAD